jgi:hypothetical protein
LAAVLLKDAVLLGREAGRRVVPDSANNTSSHPRRLETGPGGGGGTSACSAPTMNLQNLKDKHADQPFKRATPCRIHVFLLLNRHGWIQLFLKLVCVCKMFCAML